MKQKQLSPQNYVKTKARTLPISECYINEDWEESGLANIFVFRRHTTGNITFGSYLVDLYALGTKDTYFNFNIPPKDIEGLLKRGNFKLTNYILVHNIIYGANEYAEDNGFKIHKDFANYTQYILEKDDELVSFVDIEFGKNGKPVVIKVL